MATDNFENWLAEHLGGNVSDVRRLLKNKTAVHFLIAWSLFESRLFSKQENGRSSINAGTISEFSKRIANNSKFEVASIYKYAMYFHARYQCSENFRHLIFEKTTRGDSNKSSVIDGILKCTTKELTSEQKIYLCSFVAFRYRNNIFHGNKAVKSWLEFEEQIRYCIAIMQEFVSHAGYDEPVSNPAATT